MTNPSNARERVERAKVAFWASLTNANADMKWLDHDSMEEMIEAAWVGIEEPLRELLRISPAGGAQELARIGREHLQAGNIDDALTAFRRIESISTAAKDAVEAGAAALFGVSDFEGQWAELTEMSKQIYREKAHAVLLAAARLEAIVPRLDQCSQPSEAMIEAGIDTYSRMLGLYTIGEIIEAIYLAKEPTK